MTVDHDVIVVGAGPAGLACATELAGHGLTVAVVDEQAEPGGNIYRKVRRASAAQRRVLGADYAAGEALVAAFAAAAVDYLPRAQVWQAEATGRVNLSCDGRSRQLRAKFLVLSTGAMERPVPFEGWTLPGVMTCGGMSNLYKDSALVPVQPVVIAGSGPLLWLVAEHLLTIRAPLAAILDTTARSPFASAFNRHLPAALLRLDYLAKGLRMMAAVKRLASAAGVPIIGGARDLRAHGTERVERVTARRGDEVLSFATPTLLVHEGVIPNTALLRQIGCAHVWNPVQRYWHPVVGGDGRTNLPRVFVAGDGAFVHGAKAAELEGRRTALGIAKEMGRLVGDDHGSRLTALRGEMLPELRPRPFIDALYAPRSDLHAVADEVTVCRCEGVTAGEIRETVARGMTDPNEIKSLIRCGMGPCQGRMCGSALAELVAAASGIGVSETRPLRQRPPIKPVSLRELARAQLGDHES